MCKRYSVDGFVLHFSSSTQNKMGHIIQRRSFQSPCVHTPLCCMRAHNTFRMWCHVFRKHSHVCLAVLVGRCCNITARWADVAYPGRGNQRSSPRSGSRRSPFILMVLYWSRSSWLGTKAFEVFNRLSFLQRRIWHVFRCCPLTRDMRMGNRHVAYLR
jgi:hypothetical protein